MKTPTRRFADDARSNGSDKEVLAVEDGSEILASRRRRYILHCLQKYETPIALADVADEITVYENETAITDIAAEDVKRVYMSLYHTHIPKLVDKGRVTYSQDRDMIALPENDKQLDSIGKANGNYL